MWKSLNLFYVKYSEKCKHFQILQFACCKTTREIRVFARLPQTHETYPAPPDLLKSIINTAFNKASLCFKGGFFAT